MKKILSFLLVAAALNTTNAFANEQCDGSCPNSDEVMVSFADGNNLTCSCVKAGAPMNNDTAEFDPMNPPPSGPEGDQES